MSIVFQACRRHSEEQARGCILEHGVGVARYPNVLDGEVHRLERAPLLRLVLGPASVLLGAAR